jgi:hypothetical protein
MGGAPGPEPSRHGAFPFRSSRAPSPTRRPRWAAGSCRAASSATLLASGELSGCLADGVQRRRLAGGSKRGHRGSPRSRAPHAPSTAHRCVRMGGRRGHRTLEHGHDARPSPWRPGLEEEVLHHDAVVRSGAGERADGTPGDRLDGRDGLIGRRDLEEQLGLADTLLLADFDRRASAGSSASSHDAQQRVGAGEVRSDAGRAAPGLVLCARRPWRWRRPAEAIRRAAVFAGYRCGGRP